LKLCGGEGPTSRWTCRSMFGHVSLGSVSYNTQKALFMRPRSSISSLLERAAFMRLLRPTRDHICSEVAPAASASIAEYLKNTAAVEIRSAREPSRPGRSSARGEGNASSSRRTRMIPWARMRFLRTRTNTSTPSRTCSSSFSVLKGTEYGRPLALRSAAVHNVGAIASGIVRAGADFITIDGFKAAPVRPSGDQGQCWSSLSRWPLPWSTRRLTDEGLRNRYHRGRRGNPMQCDMIKAIALGADIAMVSTAA